MLPHLGAKFPTSMKTSYQVQFVPLDISKNGALGVFGGLDPLHFVGLW